jgi:hypothetical protein
MDGRCGRNGSYMKIPYQSARGRIPHRNDMLTLIPKWSYIRSLLPKMKQPELMLKHHTGGNEET